MIINDMGEVNEIAGFAEPLEKQTRYFVGSFVATAASALVAA